MQLDVVGKAFHQERFKGEFGEDLQTDVSPKEVRLKIVVLTVMVTIYKDLIALIRSFVTGGS